MATPIEFLPDDHGLLVQLESATGSVVLSSEFDERYKHIHPNCYAPKSLCDVYLLAGGGSGTAVFHGHHPTLGSMVMKHGGPRDMQEVFSLSVISRELQERGLIRETVRAAAERMKRRIPEFVMVYMSPFHMRDRSREMWCCIRSLDDVTSSCPGQSEDSDTDESDDDESVGPEQDRCGSNTADSDREFEERKKYIRRIRLMEGDEVELGVYFNWVSLEVPECTRENRTIENGHTFLSELLEELVDEQKEQKWKFTVAQKMIGGPTAENGATILTSGKLKDGLLARLIEDFTCVVRDLRKVTLPEETEGLEIVRTELEDIRKSKDISAVSKTADAFVGSAIRKNFAPQTGRLARLREFGERFRMKSFILVENEEIPAHFLGQVLAPCAKLDSVFVERPARVSALDQMENSWLDLLEHATMFENRSATDRVWTCGLTDAGLHNLFLCSQRGVELFDLGEPQLSPQPAFLTKFFMSFFHAFGMEEDSNGSWVRRFKVVGGRLSLTDKTGELIPYCYDAFTTTMDNFITEIFDDDERVQDLLAKYVVLQLLSDCAFCLMRWEEKGGGKKRFGARASEGMEKWLWRSLWDFYIACHVHQKLLVDGTDSLKQSFTQSFTVH